MPPSSVLTRLGPIPVARFLRIAWQRQPLLIRNALMPWHAPVDRRALFALARRDDAQARLVTRVGNRWSMAHGPFARLPSTRRAGWTLLVQGVDLLDAAAHALLARFRFIPDARLDDLMVSYATDGGGVGPHVDSYDVFLLQAEGRRRWRISRRPHPSLVPGAPLQLLADFRPEHEWVLEPGDLLYLPPGVAHEGTAVGESLTYSIGFRAPTYQELLAPWFEAYAERAAAPGRYRDAGLRAVRRPAALPATMVRRVHDALARHRPRPADTRRFLLAYLTEPKPQVVFERPVRPQGRAAFLRAARRRGVQLHRSTRMLYAERAIGINGEWLALPADCRIAFSRLADHRTGDSAWVARLPDAGNDLIHDWYRAGWLELAAPVPLQ